MSNIEAELHFLEHFLRLKSKPRYRIKNKSECWKYMDKYEWGRFKGTELVKV